MTPAHTKIDLKQKKERKLNLKKKIHRLRYGLATAGSKLEWKKNDEEEEEEEDDDDDDEEEEEHSRSDR